MWDQFEAQTASTSRWTTRSAVAAILTFGALVAVVTVTNDYHGETGIAHDAPAGRGDL